MAPDPGPNPADEAVKALMTMMAIPGMTTHARTAHHLLSTTPALGQMFERLGGAAAARAGVPGPGPLDSLTYAGALKHRPELAESCTMLALETTVGLVRSLRALVGDRTGRGLLIDGCAIPAWAPQVSSNGDEEAEKRLRRFAEDAGFRAIQHTSNGKLDIDQMPDQQLRQGIKGGKGKSWRGYYLVLIVDQASGLPLIWTLIDSKEQETTALVPLLSLLYHLWPDCPAEWIAGDSAWDTDACCRTCEVDYGLHPIFRLHSDRGTKDIPRGLVRGDRLLKMTHPGELICAAHGEHLIYETLDRPSRAGLRPGQSATEGAFRYRVRCEHDHTRSAGHRPCGRLSMPASFDWNKLTFYPHHSNGRPDLYSMRQVILAARLGQVESCFQALKGGHLLGGTGAGRTRIRERHVHEALISLAFLGRVALTTVDQRQRAGQTPSPPGGGMSPSSNGNGRGSAICSGGPSRKNALAPDYAVSETQQAGFRRV